jgi:hypothetical protein
MWWPTQYAGGGGSVAVVGLKYTVPNNTAGPSYVQLSNITKFNQKILDPNNLCTLNADSTFLLAKGTWVWNASVNIGSASQTGFWRGHIWILGLNTNPTLKDLGVNVGHSTLPSLTTGNNEIVCQGNGVFELATADTLKLICYLRNQNANPGSPTQAGLSEIYSSLTLMQIAG